MFRLLLSLPGVGYQGHPVGILWSQSVFGGVPEKPTTPRRPGTAVPAFLEKPDYKGIFGLFQMGADRLKFGRTGGIPDEDQINGVVAG